MKKIYIGISLVVCLGLIFSCKKTEGVNPLADVSNLGKGAYITLAENVNLNLDYATLPTSTVSIKVNQYPNGNDVDQIKVYVVKGSNSDPNVWKLVKTVPYTGDGTVLAVTGSEVATALGVPISSFTAGDYYTFYNQVLTKSGEVYDITNTYSQFESNSNYNMALRWTAYITCPFTGGMAGTYTVVQDDWADWQPGDLVQVVDGPGANQIDLYQVWPNPAYGTLVNHLVVNVDPANGVAKVPLVTFGAYPTLTTAQGSGSNGVAGYVFSCTKFITLSMKVVYGSSNQGNLKLVLKQ